MFNLVCKFSPYVKCAARITPTHKLHFLQNNPFSSSSTALKSISKASKEPSFTVSYLINSCGFPPEKALSASKYMNFETPKKPDSVIAFFHRHGFTKTQITNLINILPAILVSNPEKTLLPKLDFFSSRGVSSTDIAKIVSMTPGILKRSLENQIIPTFDLYKNLLKSEEKVIRAIKRFGGLLLNDLQIYLAANISILQESGVPESNIAILLTYQPRALMTKTEKFKEVVEEVKKMGFDPERLNFVLAIHAFRAMSKSTWEKKMEVYKKWGWSEEDVLVAFGKHPWCMMASEEKIVKALDFFINKMGWESSVLIKRPALISLSLEKRIVPRCSVYQALLYKGLIKKEIGVNGMLESTEEQFLNKFVKRYDNEAPELLQVYHMNLRLAK